MSRVRVVTDSTSDLPPAWAARLDITVVPCFLNVGARSLRDGIDISREQFYRELPTLTEVPHTAAPASGVFAEVYAQAGSDGAEVISLHPPAALSGIFNSARLGAQECGLPPERVHVLDSGQLSMGLGWQAVIAAELGQQGLPASEIAARLGAIAQHVHVFAALDTLEFLRRSGRVSWARAGLGNLLQLKQLVGLYRGEVQSLERVRTRSRSLDQLVEHVRALGGVERLAVLHANAPQEAAALCERVAGLVRSTEIPVVNVTPVIGTHVGPGAVGVAAVQTMSA